MWLSEETCRERYVRLLSMKMQELRRKPTSAEMQSDSRMPSPNDYAFYWRSFDEAVEEIWLKVGCQFAEKGGKCMAKMKKEWPHAADELLDLAVAKCMEVDRMPSRRAWLRDPYFDFEEIVAVLGKGDWKRAEMKIALAWANRKGKTVEAEPLESPKEETAPRQVLETVEAAEEPAVKRRGKRYSLEELKLNMAKVQKHFDITVIPTQVQINQAAREIGTPSYTAFLHGFGPKRGWGAVMAGSGPKPEDT